MIRLPKANKQKFFYANWQEATKEYKTDKDGNIIYVTVNGKQVPEEKVLPATYSDPIAFYASMNMGGHEAEITEFGVDATSYSAVLTTPKGYVNITETSLIWFESEPKFKQVGVNTVVDEASADYHVVKVRSSLNYDRYLIAKRVKTNGKSTST